MFYGNRNDKDQLAVSNMLIAVIFLALIKLMIHIDTGLFMYCSF